MSKEDDAFGQAYRNEIQALQATIHEMQIQMARAYRAGWQAALDEKYENPGGR